MDEELMKEVQGIVKKQREIAEKQGTDSAAYKSYVEASDLKMKEFDTQNEVNLKKTTDLEKTATENLDRIKTLEEILANGGGSKAAVVDLKADSFDVMNALITQNWQGFIEDPLNMQKAERAFASMKNFDLRDSDAKQMAKLVSNYNEKASNDLLRSDIGEYGGYLCMPEYSTEMNKLIVEYGNVRQFARVKNVSAKTYKEIIRAGIPKAFRTGEARATGKSTSIYTETDFSPQRMSNITPITQDELLYNGFNLAQELMQDNAEAFAVKEGQEFFDGQGISANEGLGWSVDPNVPEYISAASGVVTFDDLIKITGLLKRGYNPLFMFSRKTLSGLRLLKDDYGRYLWNPAFGDAASGAPATINGIRYSADFIEFDDMDTNGGFPILLADMQRFYQIVDRTDMSILRDDYTRKAEGIVEFLFQKYCFGKPKLHEAGIRMKVKA
jgi:HK97 family phage major capsid protein